MCEPTQLAHSITVVNLPLLTLIKIFEANKIYNESLIPELNEATGDAGGIFKDSLIQRVSVGKEMKEDMLDMLREFAYPLLALLMVLDSTAGLGLG